MLFLIQITVSIKNTMSLLSKWLSIHKKSFSAVYPPRASELPGEGSNAVRLLKISTCQRPSPWLRALPLAPPKAPVSPMNDHYSLKAVINVEIKEKWQPQQEDRQEEPRYVCMVKSPLKSAQQEEPIYVCMEQPPLKGADQKEPIYENIPAQKSSNGAVAALVANRQPMSILQQMIAMGSHQPLVAAPNICSPTLSRRHQVVSLPVNRTL